MIQSMQDIMKRYAQGSVAHSVQRAMVIDAANAWLIQKQPRLQNRVRVSAIIRNSLIVQCTSGVIAHEVKRISAALLLDMQRQFPTFSLHSLKCFLQGGTLPSDEAVEESSNSPFIDFE